MESKRSNIQVKNKKIQIMAIIFILLLIVLFKAYANINKGHFEDNGLVYQGALYRESFAHYEGSSKRVGYIKFPFKSFYALKGDNTYNYVWLTQFTEDYLFIKEGVAIPKYGDVTMVIIKYHTDKAIASREDIELIHSLEKQTGEPFLKNDIPKFKNSIPHNSTIYYCFDNCPVSEYKAGTIWFIKNKWIYFSKDSDKGVVISNRDITEKLKQIFSEVYENADK